MSRFLKSISLISLSLLLFSGCNSENESPEQKIQALIDSAKQAAENRDIDVFKKIISDQYMDNRGYDRAIALRIIQGIFLRNKKIHLFTATRNLAVNQTSASITILVAMTSQPAQTVDQLVNLRAELARFDISLMNENDDWQVTSTHWRRARIEDFLF